MSRDTFCKNIQKFRKNIQTFVARGRGIGGLLFT